MRRPLVAGNWKMHFTVPEGVAVARELSGLLDPFSSRLDVVVLPASIMLWEVASALRGSPIQVGAQNAAWEDQGAFTGEIAPRMLVGWCRYLLIGHSERRQLFGETNEMVNRKLMAGLRNGLRVILAVGETLAAYEAKRTDDVVIGQLEAGLAGAEPGQLKTLTVAYEPVWAIGTGKAATPSYANDVQGRIRGRLRRMLGRQAAEIRILYGGSVAGPTAGELMAQPEIDGALVGGASLKPAEFARIVAAAAESVIPSSR